MIVAHQVVMFVDLVVKSLEYIPSVVVAEPFPSAVAAVAVAAAEVKKTHSHNPSVEVEIEEYSRFVVAVAIVDSIFGVLRVVR